MDARAEVAALPPRVAHALHALLVASAEEHGPPTAAEAAVYDASWEAFSARHTAAALREAQRTGRGYCAGIRGIWCPGNRAYELASALEDRFLRDEDGAKAS